MFISLLIDGYNLLHATGAISLSRGPGGLAKARMRMLSQIAGSLSETERQRTQVVFDARRSGSATSSENEEVVRGMTVTYAVGFAEADELLEQIIRQHPQPRSLTVVSSDLRVQRCATARKATAIGSDQWLMQSLDRRQPTAADYPSEGENETKNETPTNLSPEGVQKWLKEFGL